MPPLEPGCFPTSFSRYRSMWLMISDRVTTRLTGASLKEQYRLLFMSNRTATRVLASRVAVRLSLLVLLLLGILPGGFAV
jgi:hypothetical protein